MSKKILARLVISFIALIVFYTLLSSIDYHWDWHIPWQYRELFFKGLIYTIIISVISIILGLVIGVISGVASLSKNPFINQSAQMYVELFRGTPLLVQIYIFYFCVATIVHMDSPVVIGSITLAFFSGAYISEMVRAGIESIDKGQIEAAKATGLSEWQTLRYILFPQAFRRIIPPVTGQFVSLIKDSSLLSVISVRELTKASEMINATTYRTFEAYLPLAVLYMLLTYPLYHMTRMMERRMARRD
jgi:polar amino acid transport system permease protein